jgi:hypothetical protein
MRQRDLDLKSQEPDKLLIEIRTLIEEARRQTAVAVNIGLTLLYWRIGRRIHREVLGSERAAYGEQIVVTLSRQLVVEYGRGYSEKNLRRMVQFAEAFPEEEIVVTLSRQLSWSHFSALLPLSQPFQREFYAEMCRIEGWSVRTLRERIDSMLYERTALFETTRCTDPPRVGHPPRQRRLDPCAGAERPLCAGLFGADGPLFGA